MYNYITNEDNIIVQIDKSKKVAINGYKQTTKSICCGMIDNLDDTFSSPSKSEEQIKAEELSNAKAYLTSTDWISSKYNDVVLINATMTKAEFKTKYADELAKRQDARDIINGGSDV